jgi:hypothetical protein
VFRRLPTSLTSFNVSRFPRQLVTTSLRSVVAHRTDQLGFFLTTKSPITSVDVTEACKEACDDSMQKMFRLPLTRLRWQSTHPTIAAPTFLKGLVRMAALTDLEVSLPDDCTSAAATLLAALPKLTHLKVARRVYYEHAVAAPAASEAKQADSLAAKSFEHSALEQLQLELCDDAVWAISMPRLRELTLRGPGVLFRDVSRLACKSPAVRDLTIWHSDALTDHVLLTALASLPALCELHVSHCKLVTVMTLASVATVRVCPRLRRMTVRSCYGDKDVDESYVLEALLRALPALLYCFVGGSKALCDKLAAKMALAGRRVVIS